MRLTDVLDSIQTGICAREYVICPVCNNRSLLPGEYVEHAKVGPDRCDICGWAESNGTDAYPDLTDFVSKCWELQIAPWDILNLDNFVPQDTVFVQNKELHYG